MCLAIPGKVKKLFRAEDGLQMAKVDFSGTSRTVCVEWIPEVRTGDYILIHAGSALSILDEKRALETLELLREWNEATDQPEMP